MNIKENLKYNQGEIQNIMKCTEIMEILKRKIESV